MISPWPPVGNNLDQAYPSKYLFHQSYLDDNFMKLLAPPQFWTPKNGESVDISDKFFGTKMFNIFIVQKPYGWILGGDGKYNFDWSDENSDYSKKIQSYVDVWSTQFPRFPSYLTHVWLDQYTADQIKRENPDSKMPDMMLTTGTRFRQFCNQVPGFVYMGEITSQVDANFFEPYIDDFFTPRV